MKEEHNIHEGLMKAIGLLVNIRHETDCLSDFYYEWIDKVIHYSECIDEFNNEQQ